MYLQCLCAQGKDLHKCNISVRHGTDLKRLARCNISLRQVQTTELVICCFSVRYICTHSRGQLHVAPLCTSYRLQRLATIRVVYIISLYTRHRLQKLAKFSISVHQVQTLSLATCSISIHYVQTTEASDVQNHCTLGTDTELSYK